MIMDNFSRKSKIMSAFLYHRLSCGDSICGIDLFFAIFENQKEIYFFMAPITHPPFISSSIESLSLLDDVTNHFTPNH